MNIKKLIAILNTINSDAKKAKNQYMYDGRKVFIVHINENNLSVLEAIVDFEDKLKGIRRVVKSGKEFILKDADDKILDSNLEKRCVFSKKENALLFSYFIKAYHKSRDDFEELMNMFDESNKEAYKQNWKN